MKYWEEIPFATLIFSVKSNYVRNAKPLKKPLQLSMGKRGLHTFKFFRQIDGILFLQQKCRFSDNLTKNMKTSCCTTKMFSFL